MASSRTRDAKLWDEATKTYRGEPGETTGITPRQWLRAPTATRTRGLITLQDLVSLRVDLLPVCRREVASLLLLGGPRLCVPANCIDRSYRLTAAAWWKQLFRQLARGHVLISLSVVRYEVRLHLHNGLYIR